MFVTTTTTVFETYLFCSILYFNLCHVKALLISASPQRWAIFTIFIENNELLGIFGLKFLL